jgi:N-acyl-D-aspartate/D-glutamate deacylase
MGRAGFEPATLGLKVQPNELQLAAQARKVLHVAQIAVAVSCAKQQVAEASLYARPYAQRLPELPTRSLLVPRMKTWSRFGDWIDHMGEVGIFVNVGSFLDSGTLRE